MVRQHSTYIVRAPGWTEVEGINLYHSPLGFLGEEPWASSHLISQSCKIRILILQVSKRIQMLPAASASLDPHLPNCPVSPLTACPVFLFSEGWNHSSRGRAGGTDTPGTLGDGAQRKQTPAFAHTSAVSQPANSGCPLLLPGHLMCLWARPIGSVRTHYRVHTCGGRTETPGASTA